MVLDANRALSEEPLEGVDVIRETLVPPVACSGPI